MEKIFSLAKATKLSENTVTSIGDGMFFLCQTQGTTEIIYNGEHRSLSAYDTFVGSGQKEYILDFIGDAQTVLISVSGTLIKELCSLYGIEDGFSAKAPESLEVFEEMCRLFDTTRISDTEKERRSALVIHRLMSCLCRSAGTRLVRRTSLRIKDYIDSHVTEKLELEDLSGVFFMSKTQIYRPFKEEYGVSPIRYLTKCKIELSKKMLRNENLKISEISDALSFSDAKHFSGTFLKHEGILPSEYRKIKSKN